VSNSYLSSKISFPLWRQTNTILLLPTIFSSYVFSIDECFLRFTDISREEALDLAYKLKEGVKERFGYTVNVGISENKLLAKQAGDLEKPDKCHTMFIEEIEEKLWPLPVEELFMIGRRTKPKLNRWGIYTIGELANADYKLISTMLKSHGRLIYNYAWGRDASVFKEEDPIKSVGNSSTLKFDVDDRETAHLVLLKLSKFNMEMPYSSEVFSFLVIIFQFPTSSSPS
jgi:DNA polymerase-4